MTPALIHHYPVRVEPHLTDYAGVVWHGSYLRWLEEARIDALRQRGMEYSDLVDLGCDLPVVNLELNYRNGLRMGDRAVVQSYIACHEKVPMNVLAPNHPYFFMTGNIALWFRAILPVMKKYG